MLVKKQLVVAGGGFAGITLAKKILRDSPDKFDVTLVDKNDYQLFYPALFKVATLPVEPSAAFEVSAVRFKDIFAGQNIKIVKGELAEVGAEQNKINLKPKGSNKQRLNYDYLVLALGVESKMEGLKLLSFADALNIKNRLEEIFKTKAKQQEINIVVAGGGLTGCELMAHLVRYGRKLAVEAGHPQGSLHFKLAEVNRDILLSSSAWLRAKTKKHLESLGIKIMLNTRLGEADKESADLLVWTVGAKPDALMEKLPKDFKNIFVAGGLTVQEAIRQGKYLAKVLKCIADKKRLPAGRHGWPRYKKGKSIEVAEFGGNVAFADLGFIKLQGRLAKWLHFLAFLRYFISVLSFNKALVWLKKYNNL